MKRLHNRKRLLSMHQMLLEMAGGNFNLQIPLSEYDDELESLVMLINLVAEELRFQGLPVRNPETDVIDAVLAVDRSYRIIDCSVALAEFIGRNSNEIIGQQSDAVLSEDSHRIMAEVIDGILPSGHSNNLSLQFLNPQGLLCELSCELVVLPNRENYVFLFRKLSRPREENARDNGKTINRSKLKKSDVRLVQKVYDYIVANLEEPLPSIKELAHMFATNEFKLKDGFRQLLKTSIYQLYIAERLERAKLMIEQTEMPLKKIAHMSGFNSYPNFSKAYKKRFGVAPRETERLV